MWDSVPVKSFIVPVFHLQIGLINDFLKNLLDFIDSDVEKLSTGEEGARNTLVTLNQFTTKIWKNFQIWDVNDGVMLQHKAMQLNQPQGTKESTPGLNDDIVITITSAENFVEKKK